MAVAEGTEARRGAPAFLADHWFDRVALLVLATVAALILATWRDYGITWDESWHLHYGALVWRWYSGDPAALTYRADYLYGGGFDTLGAAAAELDPRDRYVGLHLFGGLVGLAGLAGAWQLARLLGGPRAGVVALLLLATTPVYYGHMFNNPKDLPFAVGYVWALYGICRLILRLPAPRRRDFVVLTVTLGGALCVRIAGLLTVIYLFAAVSAWLVYWGWSRGRARAALERAEALAPRLLASVIGSWAIMLAFWPWAQLDPIRRPYLALRVMTHFNQHVRRMPLGGELIWTYDVRWDYLPRYFALKLPEPLLLLGAIGLAGLVLTMSRVRRDDPGSATRALTRGVLAVAILFPPAYAIYKGSILYDGLRHFLFLVPPIAVVSGLVFAWVIERLSTLARDGRLAARIVAVGLTAGLGLTLGDQVRAMVELHPHQYVYFNRIAGGLPGVYLKYDTDYYGNTYKEAYASLRRHLWETEREAFLDTDYQLSGCIPERVSIHYMWGNFQWKSGKQAPSDFYAGYTRGECHERSSGAPELLRVERQGTLLNVVRDLRKPPGPEGSVRRKAPTETQPRPQPRDDQPRDARGRAGGKRGGRPGQGGGR